MGLGVGRGRRETAFLLSTARLTWATHLLPLRKGLEGVLSEGAQAHDGGNVFCQKWRSMNFQPSLFLSLSLHTLKITAGCL